jgi:hypothetical protein
MSDEDVFKYLNELEQNETNYEDDYLSDIDEDYKELYSIKNNNLGVDSEYYNNYNNSIYKDIYTIPPKSSPDARNIWKMAQLPVRTSEYIIRDKLFSWVLKYTNYKTKENGEIIKLSWKSKSGIIYECGFNTFVKWILCASKSET